MHVYVHSLHGQNKEFCSVLFFIIRCITVSRCHNFIYFKKAFNQVWHEGLLHALRNYNFDEIILEALDALCVSQWYSVAVL